MLYLLRKVAGSMATTRTYPPAGTLTPCGKEKVTPLVNFQVSAGLAGSYRFTSALVMLSSSMNSSPGCGKSGGLYMISLMMIGPTRGGALAAPGVGELAAAKAEPPALV